MLDKLRNKNQYNQVTKLIDLLLAKATDGGGFSSLTKKESKELEALSRLVAEYEENILKLWPLPITISDVVQQKISELNITQNKLAEIFEITNSKLSKILTGKRDPDIQFLKAVHEKLGVDGNLILDVI
jgi:antitoxin component HigA of HigAB toxin-antitoxin module